MKNVMTLAIDLAEDTLLTAEQVCEKLSISRRTLDTKKKDGSFPGPTCYVFSSPRWSIKALNSWLNKKSDKEILLARMQGIYEDEL